MSERRDGAYRAIAEGLHSVLSDAMAALSDDADSVPAVTAAAPGAEGCPPATQDVALNLENRKNAIDTAMYGPLNPDEPNEEYWSALAGEWSVDVETAKRQRCGNCAVFIVSPEMKACISTGLTGEAQSDEFDSIDAAGELGYCEAFDFKCASARTCRAWVGGGPVTAAAPAGGDQRPVLPEQGEEPPVTRYDGDEAGGGDGTEPTTEPAPLTGERRGARPRTEAPELATDPDGHLVSFGERVERSLAARVREHNRNSPVGLRASLDVAKAVYRRGGASYRPAMLASSGTTRSQWAMRRVDAFLSLMRTGSPQSPSYTADNDLLPASHPLCARPVTASAGQSSEAYARSQLAVALGSDEGDYESPEDAILAITEALGMGYEAELAVRASWVRGVRNNEDPFSRAAGLVAGGRSHRDADLLPVRGTDKAER